MNGDKGMKLTLGVIVAAVLGLYGIIYNWDRDMHAQMKAGDDWNYVQAKEGNRQNAEQIDRVRGELEKAEEEARTMKSQLTDAGYSRQLEILAKLEKINQDYATIRANLDALLNGQRRR